MSSQTTSHTSSPIGRDARRLVETGRIDPRGARFAAALTTLVLAAVLLTAPSTFATALLAAQTAIFAVGAALGVQRTPYALLFRTAVRPRLAPPAETEDAAPPRFAQTVGLVFAAVALTAALAGASTVAVVATGFALAAAFLNAAFGFCLGCEVYLLIQRIRPRVASRIAHTGRSDEARPDSVRTAA